MNTKDFNLMKYFIGALSLILFIALTIVGYVEVRAGKDEIRPYISSANKKCIDCHIKKDVGEGQVNDWKHSRHAEKGIGCIECHKAEEKDIDAYKHEGFWYGMDTYHDFVHLNKLWQAGPKWKIWN